MYGMGGVGVSVDDEQAFDCFSQLTGQEFGGLLLQY